MKDRNITWILYGLLLLGLLASTNVSLNVSHSSLIDRREQIPAPIVKEQSIKDFARDYIEERSAKREWRCFTRLIGKESAWQHDAENPSGAYGLGQVKGSKDYTKGKPKKQVKVSYRYMLHKYGSACGAWEHFNREGWH
jgi:hypothetical protein